jgi:hypothetical protein
MLQKRLAVPATALVAFALCGVARAGNVGSPLPETELEGFALTEAKSIDDYVGRTILLEFFAYW